MARRKASALEEWAVYLAARYAVMGITSMSVERALRVAGAVGRFFYRMDGKHRGRMMANLRLAYPGMSEAQRQCVAQGSFEHFARLVFEMLYTPRLLHADSWPAHVVPVRLGPALELLNSRRPCIMVTGHVGSWEVVGNMMAVLGYRVAALARPIDHRKINDWLLSIREDKGMRVITKWDATDTMVGILRSGGTLAFIADQNAGERGLFVPFFGKLASTYKSIGLLAMAHDTPIICGYGHRVGSEFRYEMGVTDIIMPEDWADQPDPLYYITARYIRAIEMMVRRKPEQYLWAHRRWRMRPRHERMGKPMPAGLQRHLEHLPWMDEPTLRSLREPVDASQFV